MTTAEAPRTAETQYIPRGNIVTVFRARDPEILVEGASGTGKTRGILEMLHLIACKYPRVRLGIFRKAQVTMTATCLRTFDEQVLSDDDKQVCHWFGGSKSEPASYRYANGSRIYVMGLDDISKVLSLELDLAYINEATEATEDDWETLTGRLRGTVLPNPRIIGDCNPTHGTHWLNKRCDLGKTRRIVTTHHDNPLYFHEDGKPTVAGDMYMARLSAMSGTRRERFYLGLWTGVENACYPHFDREIHIAELDSSVVFRDGAFGADYGRVHKAASVAISVDQSGRRWVREAWGEPDAEHGRMTMRTVGRMWRQYALRRGGVDPNQDVLIGLLGDERIHRASLAEGSRQSRIDLAGHYLNVFPGGYPTSVKEDLKQRQMMGPYTTPDSPGLLFVKGAPGIEELADQCEGYHYVHKLTETKDDMIVDRRDEDLVAAMEYAMWALEQPRTETPKGGRTVYKDSRESYGYAVTR